ncbi:MAG: hypothetical protein JO032_07730, partial [Alphaproteobacteria bacterium]|nr:hypothetical protein [Alphaproteobacteria bacterium]
MTERVRAPHRLLRLLSWAGALAAAVLVDGCRPVAADNSGGTSPADVAFIERTMQEVEKSYVEPVKPNDLVTGALKGMLNRLDPHSDYMDEREFRDL